MDVRADATNRTQTFDAVIAMPASSKPPKQNAEDDDQSQSMDVALVVRTRASASMAMQFVLQNTADALKRIFGGVELGMRAQLYSGSPNDTLVVVLLPSGVKKWCGKATASKESIATLARQVESEWLRLARLHAPPGGGRAAVACDVWEPGGNAFHFEGEA